MLADRDAIREWAVAAHNTGWRSSETPIGGDLIQYRACPKGANRLSAGRRGHRQAMQGAPALAEPYPVLGDVLRAQEKKATLAAAYLQAQSLDRPRNRPLA